MAPPTKKRKVNNDTKSSPASSRNLDFFFGKQKEAVPIQTSNGISQDFENIGGQSDGAELTDEQLARKLQAEWAKEEVGGQNPPKAMDVDVADGPSEDTQGDTNGRQAGLMSVNNQEVPKDKALEGKPDGAEDQSPKKQAPHSMFAPKSSNTLSLQSAGSAEDNVSSNIPFDESPLTFDPSKYVAELQGHWAAEGGDASYALLTRCFVLVNSTQSRIKIVDTLVNLLRVIIEGDPSSLLPTVCALNSFLSTTNAFRV